MFMSASKRFVWPSCVHRFNGKYVGAYRIRPPWRRGCMFDGSDMLGVIISFSLTSGRMRYAPTPVRLKTMLYWVMGLFRFRSFEGVCDTPLHLFVYCHGQIQLIITPVRLNFGLITSWQNRQNGRDDADSGHTKPSKRSWRRWLGSHKTLKTIATMLTRVTQNRRNDRDDEIVFTYFNKCNRDG